MALANFLKKAEGRWRRDSAVLFARRPFALKQKVPIISFTFDDFPRSALWRAGQILENHGVAATYYASLGLMGTNGPTGDIFIPSDLKVLLERGHELGCHTFSHCHGWETKPADFEESILANRAALQKLLPTVVLRSLSYPISCPRPETKKRAARHFACSRGGGQACNSGTADLNNLKAFFLEQSRDGLTSIKRVIDENRHARGWLIFATHDVSETHTRFGCSPTLFANTLDYSIQSGAQILPVSHALELIKSPDTPSGEDSNFNRVP